MNTVNIYSKNLLQETAAKFLQSASFFVRVCNHYLQSKNINFDYDEASKLVKILKIPHHFEKK